MTLSAWQRIKRRVSLPGGSYTYPDGYIELDFEAAASIDRGDSDRVKERKLAQYYARQRTWQEATGAILLGFVSYELTTHAGFSTTDAIGLDIAISCGLFSLAK